MSDDRFEPGANASPRDDIIFYIEKVCKNKFRETPRRSFLEGAADELVKRLSLKEAEELIEALPLKHERFPTMHLLDADIKSIEARKSMNRVHTQKYDTHWTSKQAPGTPPAFEWLFEMIKAERSNEDVFKTARSIGRCGDFTDADLWECYEFWCRHQVNPKLKQVRKELK